MADTVHVVYSSGSRGASFPYGVFTSEENANRAREVIIKELEDTARDVDSLDFLHKLEGPLEKQIQIREVELREEFDGDVSDMFMDTP